MCISCKVHRLLFHVFPGKSDIKISLVYPFVRQQICEIKTLQIVLLLQYPRNILYLITVIIIKGNAHIITSLLNYHKYNTFYDLCL